MKIQDEDEFFKLIAESYIATVLDDDSAQIDESIQNDNSAQTDGSVQTNDSAQTDGSVQTNDSAQTDGSVQTNDSAQTDGSVQTNDSVQTDVSIRINDSAQTDESVQTNDSAQTDGSIQNDDFTQTVHTYYQPHDLCELHELYELRPSIIANVCTKFYGWIRRIRVGGNGSIVFIDIYDGTKVGALMCIATPEFYGDQQLQNLMNRDELIDSEKFVELSFQQLSMSAHLSDGCAVVVEGKIVLSPSGTTQKFEFQVHRLRVIGSVEDPLKYPIQKSSEKSLVTLRQLPFMRLRAQALQCIFRISSKLEFGIHTYMDKFNVVKIDPNIMTMSDCEGAGETFIVSPNFFSPETIDEKGEKKQIAIGLTVSSQLPLESAITGFKQVYTMQKSFRAEKSDTLKHLAEFLHLEYELAFTTLDDLMNFTEDLVKYVIKFAFDRCPEDFAFLESKFAPADLSPSREFLLECLSKPFVRIKHRDAIDLIHKIVENKMELPDESCNGKMKRVKLDKMPKHGEDIGSEHEKLLVRYFGYMACSKEECAQKLKDKKEFGAFVFLTHWPLAIKSFYMKQCDDGSGECDSFDLLAPRVGEMVGGSSREWRFDKLDAEIQRRGMDVKPIQWFLDLRKNGSMPHGGAGMGFGRLCTLVTGAPSIRETVFLPVYYGHCPY
jgi:asparaginyl-tRNA synthetase